MLHSTTVIIIIILLLITIQAFFRRSAALEAKKEFDLALADARKAQELNDVEDKLVTKAMDRIKKEIQKEKDKEKKMWGNAFTAKK